MAEPLTLKQQLELIWARPGVKDWRGPARWCFTQFRDGFWVVRL